MSAGGTRISIETVETAGDWTDVPAAAILADLAATVARRFPDVSGTVAMALADDVAVHDLNSRFRGIDGPTNVLSFPSGEPQGAGSHLGDIALSVDTLRREAAAQGRRLDRHFAHLALHGLLHLLGHGHDTDEEAAEMEGLETEILAELGMPDPYAAEPAAMSEI